MDSRMTERERLIDLLIKGPADFSVGEEGVADYLIKNGVIVPPCKVGDVVYAINEAGLAIPEYVGRENVVANVCFCTTTPYRTKTYRYDVIGKTVFTTREAAEAALAERRKNHD